MAQEKQIVVEVDSRKRISLGALAKYDRYLVDVEEDGTIVLTPAVVLPARELRKAEEGKESGNEQVH